MNILICPDKFKDSLTALQVASALQSGIWSVIPNAHITCLPLADGGEGTLEAIAQLKPIEKKRLSVRNPLLRSIKADYLFDPNSQTAYIEMARASGIELLAEKDRDAMQTSTYGTGELILHAMQMGAKKIILFVGGSATNDGGMGMACALGFEFLDQQGLPLEGKGASLLAIEQIKPSRLQAKIEQIEFLVATDVQNPLTGPLGASAVFGPQKGASPAQVGLLDKGLQNLHEKCVSDLFSPIEIKNLPGSGAAGGLGAGAQYFLGAHLISGADFLLENYQFDKVVSQHQLIITGEGKIDEQTWGGKLISKVLEAAKDKEVVLVCGVLEGEKSLEFPVFEVMKKASSKEDAIQNASHFLFQIGKEIGEIYSSQ